MTRANVSVCSSLLIDVCFRINARYCGVQKGVFPRSIRHATIFRRLLHLMKALELQINQMNEYRNTFRDTTASPSDLIVMQPVEMQTSQIVCIYIYVCMCARMCASIMRSYAIDRALCIMQQWECCICNATELAIILTRSRALCNTRSRLFTQLYTQNVLGISWRMHRERRSR